MASVPRGGVSVVVPLYNKALYVRRALESLSAQSWGGFEVVVVDDGSTDGSGDVVRAHRDPRVRLVRQDNRGEGGARNRGIAESSGWLIAMLDADDEWDPEFLETILALARRFPDAALLATGYRSRHRGGFTLETRLPGCDEGCLVRDYFALASRAGLVWSSAQAIPRSIYESVGGFGTESFGVDVDMWGRVALSSPIACSGRVLATYHQDVGPERMLTRHRRDPIFPPFVRTAREAMARGEVDESVVPALRRYINVLLLEYVQRRVAGRDRRELRRTLNEEFSPEPGWGRLLTVLRLAAILPLPILDVAVRLRSSRWGFRAGLVGDPELVRRAPGRDVARQASVTQGTATP